MTYPLEACASNVRVNSQGIFSGLKMTILSFEDLVTSFESCHVSDCQTVRVELRLFIDKLSESHRFVDRAQYFLDLPSLHLEKVLCMNE